MRIGLVAGGCAGFRYDLDLVAEPRPDDLRFVQDGVRIAIAPESASSLAGTEIDYIEDGLSSGFSFDNPNARSACGCGSSFQA